MKSLKAIALTILAMTASHVSAATILRESPAVDRNDYGGSLGYQFTSVDATTIINYLGFVDADNDGLNVSHLVSLYEYSGAGLVYNRIASTTIAAGIANQLDGGYRWNSIAPITLSNLATDNYIVMATVAIGDNDKWGDTATFTSTIGNAGRNGLVSALSLSASQDFTGQVNTGVFYNPGNIATSVVPEPTTSLLGGLGAVALLRRRGGMRKR